MRVIFESESVQCEVHMGVICLLSVYSLLIYRLDCSGSIDFPSETMLASSLRTLVRQGTVVV
jgi:hypothetical protein